jgi:membrane protein YdbS with pleckstrin-like domain
MPDDVLLRAQPKMWKANPGAVVLSIFLIPAFGLGLLILGVWWLRTWSREIVVTPRRLRKRTGILSKATTELEHRDVRNVQVEQGPVGRMMGTGTVRVSSAGQGGIEIEIAGVEAPEEIRDLLYEQRE